MKKLILILAAFILIGFSNCLNAQYIRVYVKYDGEKNNVAVRSEIRQLYLANPFHSWNTGDVVLNADRYNGYINSVKTNEHLSLVAKNPATGQREPFDDDQALSYLAKAYTPWGMSYFQWADLAGPEYNITRSWRISHPWSHTYKWINRNKMFVPEWMVVYE